MSARLLTSYDDAVADVEDGATVLVGGFGMGLPAFSHYGQGTWADGEGIAHSLGRNGFTPWFDRRSAEPSEHVFGGAA